MKTMEEVKFTVLPSSLGGGPHNLGDPNDRSLRKLERDVLIPQIIRERAKTEKCIQEVADFTECCKNAYILMPFKCKQQNTILLNCLSEWFHNPDFIEECTQQYLKERTEYRLTGVAKKRYR